MSLLDGLNPINIISGGGYSSKRAYQQMGRLEQEAAYFNAELAAMLGGKNADAILQAASNNAYGMIATGYARAAAIERAGLRNLYLYEMQSFEETRRHAKQERYTAGMIRAMQSGTGTIVGSTNYYDDDPNDPYQSMSSNDQWLMSEIQEGLFQRAFMIDRQYQTALTMMMDTADRAYIERFTADTNADITLKNAALQADVVLAEADAKEAQLIMQGDHARQMASIQGNAALASGISSFVGNMIGGFFGGGSGIGGMIGAGLASGYNSMATTSSGIGGVNIGSAANINPATGQSSPTGIHSGYRTGSATQSPSLSSVGNPYSGRLPGLYT